MDYQDNSDQAKAAFSALFGSYNRANLGRPAFGRTDDEDESSAEGNANYVPYGVQMAQGMGSARREASVGAANTAGYGSAGTSDSYTADTSDTTGMYDTSGVGGMGSVDNIDDGTAENLADGNGQAVEQDEAEAGQGRRSLLKKLSPGALVVYLMKGYVDREDNPVVFDSIVQQIPQVSELCNKLFMRLVVDDGAGYAYLRSADEEDIPVVNGNRPPRLLARRQLSFFASFILIILRQRLLEFEISGQFGRLVLERQSIIDQIKAYLYNVNNEIKLDDRLNKAIDDLCDMGVLKASSIESGKTVIERVEVKRIINAIVTPEVLSRADEILTGYVQQLNEGGRNRNLDA